MANLSAQVSTAIAQVIAASVIFRFKLNYRLLIQLSSYTLLIILMVYVLRQSEIIWFYQLSVFVFISVVLAFALRILDLNNLYRLIRFGDNVS